MLTNFLLSLTSVGVQDDLDRLEVEKVRVTNLLFFAFLPIFFSYLLMNIWNRDPKFVLFYLACIGFSSVVLILNHQRLYTAAKIYALAFNILLCLSVQFYFGSKSGLETVILAFVVFIVYLVDNRLTALIIVSIVSTGFVLLKYLEEFYPPLLGDRVIIFTPIFLFVSSIIIITSFIFDRRNKIEQFIETQKNYESTLKIKNQELSHQKELIAKQNKELETKNHELNQFAYIAAHDLKTPIRSIKSFAQLAKMNLTKEKYDKVEDFLETINENTSHLYKLIQDLLSYSLLEKDSADLESANLESVDLNKVFESCKLLIIDKLAKPVKLYADDLPKANVNSLQFKLLFQNLMENAIKYNRAEVPEIYVSATDTHDKHIISFKDNGIGIEKKYQEQIFDMFKRLHTGGEFDGSGLGLAICKKIIERHKGTIALRESSNEGSKFVIQWPKSIVSSQ